MNSTDKVKTAPREGGEALRLQVYLAHAGVASRRASEKLIAEGRVSVNGRIVSTPGEKVSPEAQVCLDGVLLRPEGVFHYLALHKPPLYICSSSDPQGRPLVRELLPGNIKERLYHVGRLDFRSSGLILFTNDGGFAAKVSHPSAGIEKEYLVEASGPIPDKVLEDFVRGVVIDQVFYQSSEIERLGKKSLRIVLIEGKNREIRRVFSYFHLHPVRLHRVRIGPVRLGVLAEGASRPLALEEREELTVGHNSPG
ncbi:MAG: rRNA pseudouridine synthase [Spirochaetaceae bacterium]|nr:rRNA pseudouridine synthase [Spirochaetaceae bacterium]